MYLCFFISRFLTELLAIVAVVCSSCIAILQRKQVKLRFFVLTFFVFSFLCVALVVVKLHFEKRYSYIPNIVGLTYDESISTLQDIGIQSEYVFLTSNNITSPSCRVSWQSISVGSIVSKGSVCFLLLDDCYSVLDTYDMDKNSGSYPYFIYVGPLPNKEQETRLKMQILVTFQKDTIKRLFYDETYTQIHLLLSADSLPSGLIEAVTYYLKELNNLYYKSSFSDRVTLNFGKLIPKDGETMPYKIYNRSGWIVSVPNNISTGNYEYICRIIREDGQTFECSIPVVVE